MITLKQFMDANTNDDALVSLVKNGQTVPFAKVSDGSIDSLASGVQGLGIHEYTVQAPNAITVKLDVVTVGVGAVAGSSTLFDVEVSDMQTGIVVGKDAITGTLKYLDGTNPIVDYWGAGNFMCLEFTASDWEEFDSVMVGLDPSQTSGLVDIKNDPDKNGVFKVTNKATQKFVVVATKGTEEFKFVYDLSGLTVESI